MAYPTHFSSVPTPDINNEHSLISINDFFKTNKMAKRLNLTTNEIVQEETKLLEKIRTKHQNLAGVEYRMFTLRIIAYKSWIKRFKFTLRLEDVILSC